MVRPPLRTDEPVDRWFSRPAAAALVGVLRRTPITPNQVTALAASFGVAAGVLLAFGQGVLSAAALAAFMALDCADGQLARIRGGGGYLGRAVDGLGDYATGVAVHLGMLVLMLRQGMDLPLTLGLVLGAAVSMSWSSFLLDRYKRRYRGDMDDVPAMRREAEVVGGLAGRLILSLIPYSARLEGGASVPDLLAYQARVRGPMRLWLLCGPTMHFAAMAVCFAFLRADLYCWIALLPLNLLTAAALLWQSRLERRAPAVISRGSATAT